MYTKYGALKCKRGNYVLYHDPRSEMFSKTERTLSVRTNSRVRQALARRDIYIEEFDYLTGELTTNSKGFVLYLPDCDLNVFLRRATTGRCSFYAIGTGQASPMCV